MKLNKFTVIMAVLLMAILAIGAVSADSIDDADASIAINDGDSDIQLSDSSAEDLSAADTADVTDEINDGDTVLTDSGDTYQITEESYSTYFNDDGTPTEALSAEGNYELQLGVLEGKNFNFNSGKNIVLSPYITEQWDDDEEEYIEVGGDLFECTLSFGPNVESVLIKGLTFHNTDKTVINVDSSNDITFADNVMFVDIGPENPYGAAIYLNGPVSNINIDNNALFMRATSSAYGINLMSYGAATNPTDIAITSNRIEIEGDFESGMVEAIYLSNPTNLIVEDNIITVNTVNDVFAYGIQVADDVQYVYMFAGYTGNITSPRNIVIKGNEFDISSEYMTYALSVLDFGVDGYDEEYMEYDMNMPHYFAFDTNTTISDNTVIAKSTQGVMAIAGQTYNMSVINNTVIAIGGSAESIDTSDALGNGTYALEVQYNAGYLAEEDYTIIVKDNAVITNVTAEHINSEDYLEFVSFENNTMPNEFLITEGTYSVYFNEDGTSTGILPELGDYTLYIDFLEDKDIKIESGSNINITSAPTTDSDDDEFISGLISEGSIIIGDYAGSAGSIIIDGLTISNSNKNGIEILDLSTNITIKNCNIQIYGEEDPENPYFSVYGINANGWIEGLTISDNYITVGGDASYSYAIQLGSYGALSNPKDIIISNNEINMEIGNGMAEAIYLDNPVNALIEGNDLTVHTTGDTYAYGIQIADSAIWALMYDYEGELTSPHDVTIKNNKLDITSDFMIYGITALSSGAELDEDGDMERFAFPLNIVISDNEVYAVSQRGIMGIAGQLYNMTVINNDLTILGGSAEGIDTSDALGNGTYALGVQYNNRDGGYYVIVKDNKVNTNVDVEFLNSETYKPWVIFENNTGDQIILIDDESYENYFNEDGTAKDTLPQGNYVLMIDQLHDKNMIISGSNIEIVPLDDENIVNDCEIILEDASSITISGLDIDNNNKNGIHIKEGCTDVTIANNEFHIYGDSTESGIYSLSAVFIEGFVSGINISDNHMFYFGDINYGYGISQSGYNLDYNPEDFTISNNDIVLDHTGTTGVAEGIYLDNVVDAVIENNNITVSTYADVIAYGMQVSDSMYSAIMYADYDGDETSPKDIVIRGNKINIESEYMIYGITVISSGIVIDEEGDPELCAFDLNITIADNEVIAKSDKGVIGIAGKVYNMTVINNNVTAIGTSAEGVVSYDEIGVGTYALGVIYNGGTAEEDYYVVVRDNIVSTDVTPEYLSSESYREYVTFENNTVYKMVDGKYLIDDTTYDIYFDENGNIKEGTPLDDDAEVVVGDLTNKKLVIDIPLDITSVADTKLVNSTVSFVEGADGSSIAGVTFEFTGDDTTGSVGIIYLTNVNDVIIRENIILVPDFVDKAGARYGSSIYAIEVESGANGCSEIDIIGNYIEINGTCRYLYGIDVFQTYGSENKNCDLTIADNQVILNGGSRMAEGIYVSASDEVIIAENVVKSVSNGSAYGIATDDLGDSSIYHNNIDVNATASNMAYGITNLYSTDVTITDNTVVSTGTGAVGIGFKDDEGITIEDNTITINGGNYLVANTSDSLGKANAAILDKGDSTDVTIGENTIVENIPKFIDDNNYDQYFNADGAIKEDLFADNEIVLLGNLTNKKLTINVPLTVESGPGNTLVNTTINLVTGADGTVIDGLNMEFTGDNTTGSIALIYAKEVNDISIINNNIVVPDFVDKAGANYGSSIYAIEIESGADGCDNVTIRGNNIDINGSNRYIYGIDVFHTWGEDNKRISNITIADNEVNLNGASRMAEAIYVSECDDVTITGNNATVTSDGAAYGIATDQLTNVVIADNEVVAISNENMAYGITSTTDGEDITIENNNITSTGVGAVGIGLSNQDNVTVDGNNININGGDFTTITSADNLGTANAAILDKDGKNTNLNIGENALIENGKETDVIKTGDGGKDLQNLIDAAPAGSTLDLGNQVFNNVANVEINKDITITGGIIAGKEGEPMFVVPAKSEGGPNDFTITDSTIKVKNANTIVKATADNDTNPTAIDTPNISIKNNNIELANDDVVAESVTVLELDSERPVLAPTGEIAVSGNTLPAGVDPFDFKVTSVNTDDGTVVPPGPVSSERTETQIVYQNMTTTAVDVDTDGRVGKYFYITLKDKSGKALANKPVQIGFNGNVYSRVTDDKGQAKLQINLKNAGTYTFAVSYLGDDTYNGSFVVAKIVVSKQKGSLTVPNKSYKASAKTKSLIATFKSASGKVVKGKKITFTVNGKTYSATTNAKGVATVKVSLNKKGSYSFTAKFAGNNMYAAITKKAKLTIK
ncbi:hypothetical protein [Methanobrevibacter sp.]